MAYSTGLSSDAESDILQLQEILKQYEEGDIVRELLQILMIQNLQRLFRIKL